MRLAEIMIDSLSSGERLAVWCESQQGWILVSELLKESGKNLTNVSTSSLLRLGSESRLEDVGMADVYQAITDYEAENRNEIRVYKPGIDCKYGRLFSSPEKILCVGLNYADHAKEFGNPLPNEPVIFNKAPSSLSFAGASIILPEQSDRVDYEGELVVVIGKDGRNVPKEQAMTYVAGYCCGNDVSARDWQKGKPAGQWFLGKSFDTFAPVGPCFVTADEVGNPNDLKIETRLNGQVMQSSNTSCFIFKIDYLISYLSQVMTLRVGDLIFTGTPDGVGDARKPPVYLKRDDEVVVEIEKIGTLTNTVY